jgi:processive 1,2-diacylglycerol beta-glucosyltransferase
VPRVLVLTADIGAGHDLPAALLADALRARGAEVVVEDSLAAMGPIVLAVIRRGSETILQHLRPLFDLQYWLITGFAPTRWLMRALSVLVGSPGLLRLIARTRPDAIVCTYPGTTEILGELRRTGRLAVPCASAITDLAALRYWAHPGVDLHLISHPESAEEVAEIAPGSGIVCVRGLTDPRFYEAREQADARRDLGLPLEGPVVLVSGGGWAVGDLEGAAEQALTLEGSTVVCLCGRNDRLRAELAAHFAAEPRVRVGGFTERMPDWFAAADLLVHSTAGLTVLEAIMRGCAVVSYGWGIGHVRVNNEAFARFGLAEVAGSRLELPGAMERALAAKPVPDDYFVRLPTAASAILGLADGELGDGGRARQQAGSHGDRD